ncbi:hypothetical protein KC19_VG131000, partial [Ceratodon purpureus]
MYDQVLSEHFEGDQRLPDDEGNDQHEAGEEVTNDHSDVYRGDQNCHADAGDGVIPEVQIPNLEMPDSSDSSSSSSDDRENFGEGEGNASDSSDDEDMPPWNTGASNPVTADEMYLRDAARTPLFANSRISVLSAVILILNCMRMHGPPSVLIDEVMSLLCKVILPRLNSLPSSEYEASKMLKKLGLK